ncbi:MAG: vWA domain-containing protein [Granulosicoccus sp.]
MKYLNIVFCALVLSLSACSSGTDTDNSGVAGTSSDSTADSSSTESSVDGADGSTVVSSPPTVSGSADASDSPAESLGESADVMVTEPAPGPGPEENFQAGSLTAGEYDDHLNAELYQEYASNYLQTSTGTEHEPYIDLAHRVTLKITDVNDKPYAAANIKLMVGDSTLLELITPANGISHIYPALDSLPDEFQLKVSDRYSDIQVERTVSVADLGEERTIEIALTTGNQPATELDLLLVIDTTGSMGDELNYLKTELTSILDNIQQENQAVNIRTGLVVYRDVGDQYVVKSHGFTDDISSLQSSLNAESYNGGGDYPEAMDQALAEAMYFEWRQQSSRVLLLIADAPPHASEVMSTWESAIEARTRQIHIVPVAASGVASEAEYLMRAMAVLTNSRYLFLTDDSGYGNSHEEPTIKCYVVTRLDSMISRVVDNLLTGKRTEPVNEEIIRRVGSYDHGVCMPDEQQ